jgi:3-oxoacyl-[acyl-carrier-protein] synthase III
MRTQDHAFRIIGTGIALPSNIVTNADIKYTLNPDVDEKWVSQKLGIFERRIADDATTTSDLAAAAVRSALERAEIAADSIDLIILATATPDRQAPATAAITQAKAGLTNAVAFDINAVCSGFLFGLVTAASLVKAGAAKRAMVVGADTFSRITDWKRKDCVFFGDGAGAAIIEASHDPRAFFDAELYTDGSQMDAFTILPGRQTFTMDAKKVFEAASTAIPQCVGRLMQRNHLCADDVDVVVPHQPSITLLQNVAWQTGVPFQKFRTNMQRYANTAGATIPIVLHETIEQGAAKSGDLLLFAAAGAGFTAGAALYRWY